MTSGQAKRLRAHLEAARQCYHAALSEGQRRLMRRRADHAWQVARAMPRTEMLERQRAHTALAAQHGFSEYALHDAAKALNCSWIAEHVAAVLVKQHSTRAYRAREPAQAWDRPAWCASNVGRGVREASKTSAVIRGLRFVLRPPEQGNAECLLLQNDRLPALIDWKDSMVTCGLAHRLNMSG